MLRQAAARCGPEAQHVTPHVEIADLVIVNQAASVICGQRLEGQPRQVAVRREQSPFAIADGESCSHRIYISLHSASTQQDEVSHLSEISVAEGSVIATATGRSQSRCLLQLSLAKGNGWFCLLTQRRIELVSKVSGFIIKSSPERGNHKSRSGSEEGVA
jgi:hypothetical protein